MKKLTLLLILMSSFCKAQIFPSQISIPTGSVLIGVTSGTKSVGSATNTIPATIITGTATTALDSIAINGTKLSLKGDPSFTVNGSQTLQDVVTQDNYVSGSFAKSFPSANSEIILDDGTGITLSSFYGITNIMVSTGISMYSANPMSIAVDGGYPLVITGGGVEINGKIAATLTGTETFTNKTIASPTITTSANLDYGTPNSITYLDASKNLKSVSLGAGLSLTSGTLSATGASSTTVLTASTNITIAGSAPNYTISTPTQTTGLAAINSPTFTGAPATTTPTLSATGAEIINASFFNSKVPFVTLEQFGAVGNGSTNDAPALVLAIASGKPIFLGQKTYLINTTVTTGSNVCIYGSGKTSVLRTTANQTMINVTGSYNSFTNFCFSGNSTGGTQTLVFCDGNAGQTLYRLSNTINNCWFLNSGGSALYIRNTQGSAAGTGHEGSFYVSNTTFISCFNGIYCDTKAEYNTFIGGAIYGCTVGVTFAAGNNNYTGGQIINNGTGVKILSGTNDGHCSMTGVKINHNTTNVQCTHTLNYVFSGCVITVGNITLTGTGKTIFSGCQIGYDVADVLTITNSPVTFNGCEEYVLPTTYSLTGTPPVMINTYYGAALLATPTLTANPFTNVSATYTITAADTYVNATANTFTVTLPSAVSITGKEYTIKNSGTGTLTLATTSSQTIDGVTSKIFNTQYSGVILISNGSNWVIKSTL